MQEMIAVFVIEIMIVSALRLYETTNRFESEQQSAIMEKDISRF